MSWYNRVCCPTWICLKLTKETLVSTLHDISPNENYVSLSSDSKLPSVRLRNFSDQPIEPH